MCFVLNVTYSLTYKSILIEKRNFRFLLTGSVLYWNPTPGVFETNCTAYVLHGCDVERVWGDEVFWMTSAGHARLQNTDAILVLLSVAELFFICYRIFVRCDRKFLCCASIESATGRTAPISTVCTRVNKHLKRLFSIYKFDFHEYSSMNSNGTQCA